MSARTPRLATAYPLQRQPASRQRAVDPQSLDGISRTTRLVAATRQRPKHNSQHWRHQPLINTHARNQNMLPCVHPVSSTLRFNDSTVQHPPSTIPISLELSKSPFRLRQILFRRWRDAPREPDPAVEPVHFDEAENFLSIDAAPGSAPLHCQSFPQ